MPKQRIMRKKLQKCNWIYFVFPINSWAWSLPPLNMVYIHSETSLKKTNNFFLWERLSIEDNFWVRDNTTSGLCSLHHSALELHLAWPCPGSRLAATVFVLIYTPLLLCLYTQLSWCLPIPLTPITFLPFLQGFLNPERRDLLETPHLGLRIQGLSLCTLSSCGSLY